MSDRETRTNTVLKTDTGAKLYAVREALRDAEIAFLIELGFTSHVENGNTLWSPPESWNIRGVNLTRGVAVEFAERSLA